MTPGVVAPAIQLNCPLALHVPAKHFRPPRMDRDARPA